MSPATPAKYTASARRRPACNATANTTANVAYPGKALNRPSE